MRASTFAIITGFLAVQPAVCDFYIFAGAENQVPDATITPLLLFFNHPPSCKDATSKAIQWVLGPNNDASHDGAACDGCDTAKAPQNWDVKRLELHDKGAGTFDNGGKEPHFTLYKESGGWGMYDLNNKNIGSCKRPDKIQYLECPDLFSNDNGAGIIYCTTSLTIKKSN